VANFGLMVLRDKWISGIGRGIRGFRCERIGGGLPGVVS